MSISESTPAVTVLMPAFNCERHIADAVTSILRQTFRNFELLIINDGSTDATRSILDEFTDPRIRLLENEKNIGLIATLNRGLLEARAPYIARMDADDISAPERLEAQLDYLNRHPDIHVLGTMVDLIDDTGRRFGAIERYPKAPDEIRHYLLEECCLIHPSVMYRRNTVLDAGGYSAEAKHAEDYDLWLRISDRYQLANLPRRLLGYRMHANQVSIRNLPTQYAVSQTCRLSAIERRKQAGEDTREIEAIVLPGLLRRARAAECTLGRDFLSWSRIYLWMGYPRNALALARRAVRTSPLSLSAWKTLIRATVDTTIPASWLRRARWYSHRLAAVFDTNRSQP